MIPFDRFQEVEMRVATVKEAERVEGSEKLVRLLVDAGEERQIVAGIGTAYDEQELIGRQIVIVANLEPRKLMGLESQGMLLAADGNRPVLLRPDEEVEPGAKIR